MFLQIGLRGLYTLFFIFWAGAETVITIHRSTRPWKNPACHKYHTHPCAIASEFQSWAQYKIQWSQGNDFYQLSWAQLLHGLTFKIHNCIWPLELGWSLLVTDTRQVKILFFLICMFAFKCVHRSQFSNAAQQFLLA